MMYIILELMGEYVEVERATSNGRTSALPQPGLPFIRHFSSKNGK